MTFVPMGDPQYLASEEPIPFRREYVGGFAYPLHGSTADTARTDAAHNLIGGNIAAALHAPARLLGLRVSAFTLRLAVQGSGSFFFPDVMVFRQGADDHAQDPLVLVEILSDHTVERDRPAKYAAYTHMPTVHAQPCGAHLPHRPPAGTR